MYDIIKQVILSGDYELKNMLTKIDTIWIKNDITEEQRTELIALANENAVPENNYANVQEQINALVSTVNTLTTDLKKVKDRVTVLEGGEVDQPEPKEEYPAWYMWDGLGTCPWQTGSKCTHNGKKWESQVDNNIWEPGAPGVHETIWKEVIEEQVV